MTILQRRCLIMAAAGLLAAPALARAGTLMPVKPLEMDWAMPFNVVDGFAQRWVRMPHAEFSFAKALYRGALKGPAGDRLMAGAQPWNQNVHGPKELRITVVRWVPKREGIWAQAPPIPWPE